MNSPEPDIAFPDFRSDTFEASNLVTISPDSLLTKLIDAVVTNKSRNGFVADPKSQLPDPCGIIEPVTANAVSLPLEPLYSDPLI